MIQVTTTTKTKLVSLCAFIGDTDGGYYYYSMPHACFQACPIPFFYSQACPLPVDLFFFDAIDIGRGDSNTRSPITGITDLKLLDLQISGALPADTLRLKALLRFNPSEFIKKFIKKVTKFQTKILWQWWASPKNHYDNEIFFSPFHHWGDAPKYY